MKFAKELISKAKIRCSHFSLREKQLALWLLYVFLIYTFYSFFHTTFGICYGKWEADFVAYYAAAKQVKHDKRIYNRAPWPLTKENVLSQVKIKNQINPKPRQLYLYPPFLVYIMQSLTYVPYGWAEMLWYALMVLAYWTSVVWLLIYFYRNQWIKKWDAIGLGVLAAYWSPIYFSLWQGQIVPLVLLCITAHYIWSQEQKEFLAGFALGLAVMLKITPILLIGIAVLQKRWKLTFYILFTIIMLIILTSLNRTIYYLQYILPYLLLGENSPINFTLMGTYLRMTLDQPWGWINKQEFNQLDIGYYVLKIIFILGLAFTYWGAWKSKNAIQYQMIFASVLAAMVVFTPVIRLYDFVYLLPAIYIFYIHLQQSGSVTGWVILIVSVGFITFNITGILLLLSWNELSKDLLSHPACIASFLVWLYFVIRKQHVLVG